MTLRQAWLYIAFVCSGVAGLTYEVLWSRYLGIFVGHSAYAQVLVLAVYLGGMAVGAAAVGERSRRLRSPLLWYVGVEAALAGAGLLFPAAFVGVTELAYEHLFPVLASAPVVGSVRWALSGLLILPQAMLLGATFPLMAAGLVRADPERPGGGVATAYLWNTLGGAAGVALAGFALIPTLGLPGTSFAAAALNLAAAALVFGALRGAPGAAPAVGSSLPREPEPLPDAPRSGAAGAASSARPGAPLLAVMLTVAFGTAVASFGYEIGWIRMLSLLLGSATHSFDLMLSAFLVGLALGALLVRRAADRHHRPERLVGWIQVAMGIAAVATLPVYMELFPVMASLVRGYEPTPMGMLRFDLARYAMCLAVMLPATVLAGMTLPAITSTLIRTGAGEEAIGRVYAVNTVGAVLGAAVSGLVALPLLGLKGLLVAGATLDAALGLWLLARFPAPRRRSTLVAALAAGGVLLTVAWGVRLDQVTLTSGVYRYARVPEPGEWRSLYYKDGRTATISAHVDTASGLLVISTNGKPDASLGARWYVEGRDTLPPTAVEPGRDFMTQVLAPLVGLAHVPDARSAANVGHGSGMTGTTLLTSDRLGRLVNIEIEPAMVEGSFVFYPANRSVFEDPRSTFAFDDAKSFFAYTRQRFDLIFLEPSNPWVSGVASLFTREFYHRAREFLSRDGVLVQWMQMYEMNDDLVLTVLAAVDDAFEHYRGYRVGDMDLAIVATNGARFPEPDWSVVGAAGVREIMLGAPPLAPELMSSLVMFDERTFRPLLDDGAVRANSDFHPVLEAGAERARLESGYAEGMYSFSANRLDLRRVLAEERQGPVPFRLPSARGVGPFVDWGKAAWLRKALAEGGAAPPIQFLAWSESLINVRNFFLELRDLPPYRGWESFASAFERVERELNWGTTGWVNETLYRPVYRYLDRWEAPPEARAAVDFHHGLARFDWPKVAEAADRLIPLVAAGRNWVSPHVLLDASVVAYLRTGRPTAAQVAMDRLAPRTTRKAGNLRNRLLRALILQAQAEDGRRAPPPAPTMSRRPDARGA